jgi:hypothetical protein
MTVGLFLMLLPPIFVLYFACGLVVYSMIDSHELDMLKYLDGLPRKEAVVIILMWPYLLWRAWRRR